MCYQMCMLQSPYVKTEVGLLRDHSQHYTITAITKWLERLAFLVFIWVEKESFKRHKDLTWMNINNKLITVTATATTRECLPSETWLAMPIFKDVTCVPNVLVWYTVIWYLQLLSELLKSFQPLSAIPHLTTRIQMQNCGNQSCRKHAISLISWILCIRSWLPYYISSMQL